MRLMLRYHDDGVRQTHYDVRLKISTNNSKTLIHHDRSLYLSQRDEPKLMEHDLQ